MRLTASWLKQNPTWPDGEPAQSVVSTTARDNRTPVLVCFANMIILDGVLWRSDSISIGTRRLREEGSLCSRQLVGQPRRDLISRDGYLVSYVIASCTILCNQAE